MFLPSFLSPLNFTGLRFMVWIGFSLELLDPSSKDGEEGWIQIFRVEHLNSL
jgi:hypothetical protein